MNHALEFVEVVGMIVRAHMGERQIQNGARTRVIKLDEGVIVDMTGGSVKYYWEFRVWHKQKRDDTNK